MVLLREKFNSNLGLRLPRRSYANYYGAPAELGQAALLSSCKESSIAAAQRDGGKDAGSRKERALGMGMGAAVPNRRCGGLRRGCCWRTRRPWLSGPSPPP